MLISAMYSVSGIRSYFSCSKSPKLGLNNSSEFFSFVETSQNRRECVIRFVSLPHSVICIRYMSIMLQRNRSEA